MGFTSADLKMMEAKVAASKGKLKGEIVAPLTVSNPSALNTHDMMTEAVKKVSEFEKNLRLKSRKSSDRKELNKTEEEWFVITKARHSTFAAPHALTFKLGHDCRYTPDFICIDDDGKLIAYEVKGFMRDDALVKLKTAARMFPWVDFILVKKKKGGGWEEKLIPA